MVEAVKEEAPKGYPRENPPNPLKLDPQAATKVEVRVDSSTVAPMMMMGGEIPGNAGTDYPIFDTIPETKFNCNDQATGGYYADVDEGRCQVRYQPVPSSPILGVQPAIDWKSEKTK